MTRSKLLLFIFCLTMINTVAYCLMSPIIQKSGRWESLSSSLVVSAKIDGNMESVCLPKLEFKEDVDKELLDRQMREGIVAQDAVFNLYHDGLGRPKKQGGMLFAADVYLKDLDMTFTGYIKKLGYKFSLSKKPAYEDSEYLKDVIDGEESGALFSTVKEIEKKNRKKEKESKERANKSTLRVTTVYDMLPAGVIPPSIRSQQLKIAQIVNNLKIRPYETEIIQIDPLRWASGYMGLLNEKGEIDMAKVESQIVDLVIRVPEKPGWLTKEMLDEIKQTPCEFVIKRYKNGNEVVEGTRYLLQDIYFGKLKLTWEEWLKKHGLECPAFVEKPEYATGVVPMELHPINGVLKSLDALVITQINFTEKSNLVFPQEIMRVFAPKPKPVKKQMIKFLRTFNEAYKGKKVSVHVMVCPDGKTYTELGQKRAKRIIFTDSQRTFEDCEAELIKALANQ